MNELIAFICAVGTCCGIANMAKKENIFDKIIYMLVSTFLLLFTITLLK